MTPTRTCGCARSTGGSAPSSRSRWAVRATDLRPRANAGGNFISGFHGIDMGNVGRWNLRSRPTSDVSEMCYAARLTSTVVASNSSEASCITAQFCACRQTEDRNRATAHCFVAIQGCNVLGRRNEFFCPRDSFVTYDWNVAHEITRAIRKGGTKSSA